MTGIHGVGAYGYGNSYAVRPAKPVNTSVAPAGTPAPARQNVPSSAIKPAEGTEGAGDKKDTPAETREKFFKGLRAQFFAGAKAQLNKPAGNTQPPPPPPPPEDESGEDYSSDSGSDDSSEAVAEE
jgi:hypothetical protein